MANFLYSLFPVLWLSGVGKRQARAAWPTWGSEAAFSGYAEAHLAQLEASADVERLHTLAAAVRRSFRSLRQAPEARSHPIRTASS